jgi:hypothetical protein
LPINPESRRNDATYRADACDENETIDPSEFFSRMGNFPTGDLFAFATSVLTVMAMPLYSAAINVAKARKDASGAYNV